MNIVRHSASGRGGALKRWIMVGLSVWVMYGCGSLRPAHEAIEREIRILDLLEIKPETPTDSASCIRLYTLNSPDRYIYKRLPDDPSRPVLHEYDVPSELLPNISTRGLLETGLGHPRNSELSPASVCSSILRCRESMFELRNVWREFEQRPDALEECLKRYNTLNVSCEPLLRDVKYGQSSIFFEQMQICLIEVVLTRPKFLEQLSRRAKQKLTAKVLAKHKLKDKYFQSELGKTQGLWLLCQLMLHAGDQEFIQVTREDPDVETFSRGSMSFHTLHMKAMIITNAERFVAGQ